MENKPIKIEINMKPIYELGLILKMIEELRKEYPNETFDVIIRASS